MTRQSEQMAMSEVTPHEFTGEIVNGERICLYCAGTVCSAQRLAVASHTRS